MVRLRMESISNLDPKSQPYIMLGYCDHSKGYRLGDPVDGTKMIKAPSVEFIVL